MLLQREARPFAGLEPIQDIEQVLGRKPRVGEQLTGEHALAAILTDEEQLPISRQLSYTLFKVKHRNEQGTFDTFALVLLRLAYIHNQGVFIPPKLQRLISV